jgi:hypothetical protein
MKTERLRFLINHASTLINQENEVNFKMKPSPTKWSKQEILGHLIDSATNNHQRFVRSQFEKIPKIPYDQNEWNKCNYYNSISKTQLVNFWKSYNEQILSLIELIPIGTLNNLCNTGGNENVTIDFLFNDYVEHTEHHLKQIVNID